MWARELDESAIICLSVAPNNKQATTAVTDTPDTILLLKQRLTLAKTSRRAELAIDLDRLDQDCGDFKNDPDASEHVYDLVR